MQYLTAYYFRHTGHRKDVYNSIKTLISEGYGMIYRINGKTAYAVLQITLVYAFAFL